MNAGLRKSTDGERIAAVLLWCVVLLPACCEILLSENLQLRSDEARPKRRSEATFNAACRVELEALLHWLEHHEAQVAQQFISCCWSQDDECDCKAAFYDNAARMPEDWAQERGLLKDCSTDVETHCADVKPGRAALYRCLALKTQEPGFNCSLPPIGGRSVIARSNGQASPCKVALVSTYPPKNCGLATFTHALVQQLRTRLQLPKGCHVGIIALSDPADVLLYADPLVDYDLRYDLDTPSMAILEAVHFMHKAAYTHVIIQQEFGLTPTMWQLADLARWLDPAVKVHTVVHNPRAAPRVEERGIIRALSQVSERMIVMTWFGWHSLVAAYGLAPEKVLFIPHGVDLPQSPAKASPQRRLLQHAGMRTLTAGNKMIEGLPAGAQLVISNGLFTHYKRLDRIISAMGQVVERHPDTYVLLLGREHPSERLAGRMMKNLIDQARAAGVEDRLLWLDAFQSPEALSALLQCSAAFLAPFDEQSPTSGTLLMAMAHGLPIVSTPTHHALELLHNSRGIIFPYEDTDGINTLAEALIALLGCSTLRSTMGARAQEVAKAWTWQSVALQYAALLFEESPLPAPLLEDPFLSVHFGEATASWHGASLRLLSGHARNLTADMGLHGFKGGRLYALYVDVDIQVNVAVSKDGRLTSIGISTCQWWLMVNERIGVDWEFDPTEVADGLWPEDSGLSIDLQQMTATIKAQNIDMSAELMQDGMVSLTLTLKDRFAVPHGVMGQSYINPLDPPSPREEDPFNTDMWTRWALPDEDIFSTGAPSQQWAFHFQNTLRSNVRRLPEHMLQRGTHSAQRQPSQSSIPFRMEADIFGPSGIAQVNRRYWLQLKRPIELLARQYTFQVCLVPQYPPSSESIPSMGVLEYLIFAALKAQGSCGDKPLQPRRWPGILFRSQWPPKLDPALPAYVCVHQQAFEFDGIPKAWVQPLNTVVDELWVPSQYNADIFRHDGINQTAIQVLPHGLEVTKFLPSVMSVDTRFNESFVFLFNGGLLPRKGLDILLQAYTEAFLPSDKVALIVHSSYGDQFWKQELQDAMGNTSQPVVLFFQEDLAHIDLLRLFRSAHVYVSPFRSEGFGLGTLEAMAMGLQVLVTDFGPSREMCPAKPGVCTFISSRPADCLVLPCSDFTFFGEETVHQPSWSEPNMSSLVAKMKQFYVAGKYVKAENNVEKEQLRAHANRFTWYKTGTAVLQRLKALLEEQEGA